VDGGVTRSWVALDQLIDDAVARLSATNVQVGEGADRIYVGDHADYFFGLGDKRW
jgi:hypothetical protein